MGNQTICCCAASDPTGSVVEQETVPQQPFWSQEDKPCSKAESEAAADKEKPSREDTHEPITCEFSIKLTRADPSEPWGLGLRKSTIDDSLVVMTPAGSALEAWEEANPTKKLKKWDEIISVNGVSGAKDIVDTLKDSVELNIIACRLLRITVELTKDGPLGLTVIPGTLAVGKITDGVILSYNRQCAPTRAIKEEDKLVSINDTAMDKSEDILPLLAEIPEGGLMKLVFSRNPVS